MEGPAERTEDTAQQRPLAVGAPRHRQAASLARPALQSCIPAGIGWCMQAESLCSCCHPGLLRCPLPPRLQNRCQLTVIPAGNQAGVGNAPSSSWLPLQLPSGQLLR